MAQDRADAIPDAMDCIGKVCLKVLPFLAMLEGVRVDSAVKVSAFDDVPDRSQFLIGAMDMSILTGYLQACHGWESGGLFHEDPSLQFR